MKRAWQGQDICELCELLCSRIEQLRRGNNLAICAYAAKYEDRAVWKDCGCMPRAGNLRVEKVLQHPRLIEQAGRSRRTPAGFNPTQHQRAPVWQEGD